MSRTHSAALPSALDLLDADVRDEVRRNGVDPLTDAAAVRRFAQAVVRDHDQRSLTGSVRPIDDPDSAVDELVARVSGFGPLQKYLDDPTVEEIWINEPDRVFVARDGRHELTTTILNAAEVADLVERMLKTSGRRLDVSTPFVDALLPSGHRLHVVLDGVSRGFSAVNVRKFVVKANRLADLVALGTLTRPSAAFLEACVVAGLNLVVAGGTQAGKTTMLNTLGSAVPGGERIVSVEEVYELPNTAIVQTCGRLSRPYSHESSRDRGARATGRPHRPNDRNRAGLPRRHSRPLLASGRPGSVTTRPRTDALVDQPPRGC